MDLGRRMTVWCTPTPAEGEGRRPGVCSVTLGAVLGRTLRDDILGWEGDVDIEESTTIL